MNNKVVGGLIAVLVVSQIVQFGMMSKLSNAVSQTNANMSQQSMAMSRMVTEQSQAAAVGATYLPPPPDPDGPQGVIVLYLYTENGQTKCGFVNTEPPSTSTSGGTPSYDNNGNANGCDGDSIIAQDGSIVAMTSQNASLSSVSGSNGTSVMQYKLVLAGFLKPWNVTGKMDTTTQAALKAFQKSQGITQTGTYGSLTSSALDREIAAIRISSPARR